MQPTLKHALSLPHCGAFANPRNQYSSYSLASQPYQYISNKHRCKKLTKQAFAIAVGRHSATIRMEHTRLLNSCVLDINAIESRKS